MQRQILALALFAALPLAASAQSTPAATNATASSITVYGIVDAALAREDTGGPGGERTVLNSGNQSGNRLGFRGTENLGLGLKAMFNLEAGFNVDTGAGDAALFGRRAVVGLEGAFGLVTLGREYSPIASIAGQSDIMGQGFYGTNLSAFTNGRLTRRISNSVNYKSQPWAGFKLLATYGLGETTSGPSGDIAGVGLEYANGPLFAGIGYHRVERLASGDDDEYMLGAGYRIGTIEVKANYMVGDRTGGGNRFEQFNLGASFAFGPAGKLFANLQRNEQAGARGNLIGLAYSHSLSKRTNVYTSVAKLRNNASGLFGFTASGPSVTPPAGFPGVDPSAFSVGLRHLF